MSWCCEGFQPGTPLQQPAPATAFVPLLLQRAPPPHPTRPPRPRVLPEDRPSGRDSPPRPQRRALRRPAATAICSRAGGRTTLSPGLGQPPPPRLPRGLSLTALCRAQPRSPQTSPAAPGPRRLRSLGLSSWPDPQTPCKPP